MVAAILALAFLFISPGSYGSPFRAGNGAPAAPIAVPGHPLLTPVAVATAPPPTTASLLIGSDPRLDTPVDAPALTGAALAVHAMHPINTTAIVQQNHPSAPTTPPAPHPAAAGTGCPVTAFTGFVKNYSGTALSGVSIQAYSVNQCVCPQSSCPAVGSTANGSFTVKAPVGADYITFSLSGYLDNLTYATGVQGITTALPGTIYMVQEAWAVGTVEANTSKHPGISGVQVKALSRDLQLVGNPSGSTGSNGYFKIAVPPVPSQISFSPPYGYLPTYLDVNATPGEQLNLGIIYLDKEPQVTATLYDAVTGQPVPSGNCNWFDTSHCHAIWVCSSISNSCLTQGPSVGTSGVTALGPLGYDYVKAEAVGYIENVVPIGLVTTSPFSAGRIYMVPLGVTPLSVSVTHNTSSTLPYGTGFWVSSQCSMNGYSAGFGVINPATYTVNMSSSKCLSGGCVSPSGQNDNVAMFPLRNDINIVPDTTGQCFPPNPTWPIPGLLPVWGNETYVNATPDMLTPTVYLNLTPGNYVYGNVTVDGTSLPPSGGFTVLAQSADNPTIAAYAYNSQTSGWNCQPYPSRSTAFCAAVPPGPGKLLVQSLTQSYEQNFTWGSTPYVCCYRGYDPLPLWRYTANGISTTHVGVTGVNLTAEGGVSGRVFRDHTNLGVFFGSVQVTPAGSNPIQPSFDGPIFINGTFSVPSASGWVYITASASGYSPDTVWAYVPAGKNISIGNISLTPLATLSGQIVDPTGHGIYDATVKYCPLVNPLACSPLGAGLSTSDGVFNGTVTGGWLPWTTYKVQATASGYTSDWAWVNGTAGNSSTVPTLTLYPAGTNTTPSSHVSSTSSTSSSGTSSSSGSSASPASSSVAPSGVWVDGYLRDPLLDWGVVTNAIQACPLNGLACDQFNQSNQDGYFNDSITPGQYNLIISPLGFTPVTVYVNATQAAVVHLGNILMSELPWVQGRANITPLGDISVKHGTGWVQIQLAPGAAAFACSANGSVCGVSLTISSQGNFYVMTAGGSYNKVQVAPTGATVATSPNGGFTSNVTIFNTTGTLTNLTEPIELTIYTMVAGAVYDNASLSPLGARPWLPVRFAPVAISTFGPNHASVAWTTNGAGWYEFFVPPGPNDTIVSAGGAPYADIAKNVTSTQKLLSTVVPTVYSMPSMNLTHYGWIIARISASPNGSAASFVGVSASYNDPINGTLSSTSQTNANGYVNLTAAPGHPIVVTVGPGSDFNGTTFSVWVNSSQTTFVNGTQFWGLGNETIEPWGWVRSTALNSTSQPELPTVIDVVKQLPLPLAQVVVAANAPGLTGTATLSNWNGEFLVDAPISRLDSLVVTHSAYLQNTSIHVVKAGETLVTPTINMTGIGVLAGTVLSYPGNQPIPFATIQACPYNSTGFSGCYSTTANSTGVFWVGAVPGLNSIVASAPNFVPNSAVVARSSSDTWSWLSPIILSQFSFVTGVVRGLPSGLPIFNATVSACSPLGHPVGACGFSAVTPTSGSFTIAVPAGQYILQANATDYNTTYLPIGLVPGEILPVGILFLKQFGTVFGQVLSSATFLPVNNASVIACADWSGGACAPSVTTDSLGHFIIAAAPGPYTLAVLATGYQDAYGSATFRAGLTGGIPPIMINPLGSDVSYVVTGRVVNASDPAQGIGGATVAALVGNVPDNSTQTKTDGSFSLTVLYGTYTLLVTANGYVAARQAITAHGPIGGLIFPLNIMTYNVTGIVTDGLTHQVLPGVEIDENGIALAVSDVNGAFGFSLANGSHQLTTKYLGNTGTAYQVLPFSLVINGAPQVHNLQLFPPTITMLGVVVDSISGTALPGATVTITGQTVDGLPISQTLHSDAAGGFSATLPLGTYTASATYTGYEANTVTFTVTTAGGTVPLSLAPVNAGGSSAAPSGSTALYVLYGSLGAILLGVLLLAYLAAGARRRRSGPKPPAARPRALPATGGAKR